MTDLTEKSLEAALVAIKSLAGERKIAIKPTAMRAIKPYGMSMDDWRAALLRAGYELSAETIE